MENEGNEGHHHYENVHGTVVGSVEKKDEKAEENNEDEGHHQEANVQ